MLQQDSQVQRPEIWNQDGVRLLWGGCEVNGDGLSEAYLNSAKAWREIAAKCTSQLDSKGVDWQYFDIILAHPLRSSRRLFSKVLPVNHGRYVQARASEVVRVFFQHFGQTTPVTVAYPSTFAVADIKPTV